MTYNTVSIKAKLCLLPTNNGGRSCPIFGLARYPELLKELYVGREWYVQEGARDALRVGNANAILHKIFTSSQLWLGLENLLLNLTPSNSTDVYLGYSEGSIIKELLKWVNVKGAAAFMGHMR